MTSPSGAPDAHEHSPEGARIVADIGGTNARFATVDASVRGLRDVEVFACVDHPAIDDAIAAYIGNRDRSWPQSSHLALANPWVGMPQRR